MPESGPVPAALPEQNLAANRTAKVLSIPENAGYIPTVTKNANMRTGVQAPATSWDGRLAFRCYFEDHHPGKYCVFNLFQPERIVVTKSGVLDFSSAFSADFRLRTVQGSPFSYNPTAQFRLAAISQDPTFNAPNGNPWRCNKAREFDANGIFDCYEVMLMTYRTVNDNFQDGELLTTRARVTVESHEYVDGERRPLKIPQIVAATMKDAWIRVQSGGQKVSHWEPSLTADGRLLFVHDAQYMKNNSTSKDFNVFAASWSGANDISRLHLESSAFKEKYPLARRQFRDAFGRICDGYPRCGGHYHWVSPGGEDLFFTRFGLSVSKGIGLHVLGASTNYTERYVDGAPNIGRYTWVGSIGAIGGMTGSMWFNFDQSTRSSPFPVAKSSTVYPMLTLFGYSEYDPVRGSKDYDVYLPMTEMMTQRPVPGSGADDMVFEDGAWRVVKNSPFSRRATPDISGHFNTGRVNAGAFFPNEYMQTFARGSSSPNQLSGFIGRGLYLTGSGTVQIDTKGSEFNSRSDNLASLRQSGQSLNVHIAVKAMADLANVKSPVEIAKHGEAWRLILDDARHLVLSVTTKDGKKLQIRSPAPVELSEKKWTVLMANIFGKNKSFSLLVNGERVAQQEFSGYNGYAADDRPVIIGPNVTGAFANKPLLQVDEFGLSLRSRSLDFAADAAGFFPNPDLVFRDRISAAVPAGLKETPTGLAGGDMMISRDTVDLIASGTFPLAVELGERLFADKDLAGKGVACATCHNPEMLFHDTRKAGDGDRVALSSGVNGRTTRHTPVAFNRAWSIRQFADGRARSLNAQVLQPIENPVEMGGSLPAVLERLRQDAKYSRSFMEVFGREPTRADLATALATYLITVKIGDSEFDQVRHKRVPEDGIGRAKALLRGYGIFAGKGGCIGCHRGSTWSDEEFHNTGSTARTNGEIFDFGRLSFTGVPSDRGAVKTPTLRAVGRTAPYMVNGSLKNLNDVVSFYEKGGNANSGLDPQMRPFRLTPDERRDLIEFLKSL